MLERHLKREEVIAPKREIGRFRGEPVYRRVNVLSCKTAENWMRMGRKVRDKQEPMKWVKQRAVTLVKRRAQELALQEGQDPIQQGLYSESQTTVYRPTPIVDVRFFAYRPSWADQSYRGSFRKILLEISICMRQPCYLMERYIYLVSVLARQVSYHTLTSLLTRQRYREDRQAAWDQLC